MTAISTIQRDQDKVETESNSYVEMKKLWALPRTLMGGTRAMRLAGTTYLPQEEGEEPTDYQNRIKRSTLFNAFRSTVGRITGKIFAKPIVLAEDISPKIKEWMENVDLSGRNLDIFATDVVSDCLQTGITHILVDMQQALKTTDADGTPRPPTQAEERAAGRRPYWVHVKAENLIGWRYESIDGVDTLTQIRIKETLVVPDGEFGETTKERIRVLWRDKFEVYERTVSSSVMGVGTGSNWTRIEFGKVTLGKIPLATFYTNRTGFMTAEPPLEDLADLNVAHWQSSSDQRHILHFARVPILFGAGLGEKFDKMNIGPNRLIVTNNPEAKFEVVEHTGAAIESGDKDLTNLEDRMRVMGLELFIAKPGNVTATSRQIDSEEVNSTVKMWALGLQDTIERALGFSAEWDKQPEVKGGSVKVNTDYGISVRGAQDIESLIKMRETGEISRETFWTELKRRGVLSDDFDMDEEKTRLEDEMPDSTGDVDPETGEPVEEDEENAEDENAGAPPEEGAANGE